MTEPKMAIWNRTVQKTGPGSLGINLPKSWVRDLKVEKGDNLEVSENEEGLLIRGDTSALN